MEPTLNPKDKEYEDYVAGATGDRMMTSDVPVVYAILALANRVDKLIDVVHNKPTGG